MKLTTEPSETTTFYVAPYTGAWIETVFAVLWLEDHSVAPYTGAWIETPYDRATLQISDRSPLHGGVD